ncbi:transient receptor potential cation channel subfamily V member 5-like [Lampetra planeri]
MLERGFLGGLLSRAMNLQQQIAVNAEDELYLLQHKKIRETPLFTAAKSNDVEAIDRLHKQGDTDLLQRGVLGETALHVAVQYENLGAALALLDAEPTLINERITSSLYQGQTALHTAVLNQNVELAKQLLARGANAVSPRASGTYFTDKHRSHAHYGEYVLSFAASTGNLEMVRLLLKHGARVCAQDSQGNTVLHTLVLHKNRIIACQMYDFILANTQRGKGQPCPEAVLNCKGYTPLKLAAAKGNVVMFRHLVKRRRVVQWSVGTVTSTLYDLSEIDSWEDDRSVLEIITTSHKPEARQILEITPVKELTIIKWTQYGRSYFRMWTMLYMVYITSFSLACIYRPLMMRTDNVTDPRDDVVLVQKPLSESYQTQQDFVRLGGEIVSILGAILILVLEMLDVIRVGASRYFGNIVTGGHFHMILVCYACLVGLLFVMRLAGAQGESVPMSLALVLGWCYTLFFAHGVEMLGPFMVTIQKVLFEDVFRVCWLMFMVLMGFTCAFHLTFQILIPDNWNQWRDFYTAWFTMYQLFLGLVSHWFNVRLHFSDFIKVVYTFYMLFAFVLMINLLIAVMRSTYSRMAVEKEQLWHTQVAATTILLERRLPRCLRFRAGVSGKEYGLGDRRFLRIEDRNERAIHKVKRYAMAFSEGRGGSVEDMASGAEGAGGVSGHFTRSPTNPQPQQRSQQLEPPTIIVTSCSSGRGWEVVRESVFPSRHSDSPASQDQRHEVVYQI